MFKHLKKITNKYILGNKRKYTVVVKRKTRNKKPQTKKDILTESLRDIAHVDHPETRIGKLKVGYPISIRKTVVLDMVGDIDIGDYVIFSDYVNIMTHDHNVKSKKNITKQDKKKGVNWSSIKIGNDVYFGLRSVVTKNVTNIPNGFVLGANAVLTKNPKKEYEIWAGVPAKKIGERK